MAIQSRHLTEHMHFVLARYKTNGDRDTTFNGVGFQSAYLGPGITAATSVAVNVDGKIALGGANANYAIVLYNHEEVWIILLETMEYKPRLLGWLAVP